MKPLDDELETYSTTKLRVNYRQEGVRVGKAKYGKGVFAAKEFYIEDFIGPVAGEVIIDPDYGSDYGIDLGEHTLEPAAPFRFLNHSCEPNCELVYFEDNEDDPTAGPQIWIEIIRDISRGEQMTIDYAWPADSTIRCGCGSENCRGWIVASDMAEALRERVAVSAKPQAAEGGTAIYAASPSAAGANAGSGSIITPTRT